MAHQTHFCAIDGELEDDSWSMGPATADYDVEPVEGMVAIDPSFNVGWFRHGTRLNIAHSGNVATLTLEWPNPGGRDLAETKASIVQALEATHDLDFRTLASLGGELDLPKRRLAHALEELIAGGVVRRPIAKDPRYADWYRLTSRGFTWQERVRRLRALAGRDSF